MPTVGAMCSSVAPPRLTSPGFQNEAGPFAVGTTLVPCRRATARSSRPEPGKLARSSPARQHALRRHRHADCKSSTHRSLRFNHTKQRFRSHQRLERFRSVFPVERPYCALRTNTNTATYRPEEDMVTRTQRTHWFLRPKANCCAVVLIVQRHLCASSRRVREISRRPTRRKTVAYRTCFACVAPTSRIAPPSLRVSEPSRRA